MTAITIRTEAEYEAALSELIDLWGAEDGTPEGARLDQLFDAVEAYEDQHYPIAPPSPEAA
jgi:HTH-type transcriptional regulator/antitoxin HigA